MGKVGLAFNPSWTWEKCGELFRKIDIDHDKSLSLDEFVKFFRAYLSRMKEESVRKGIAAFHANLNKKATMLTASNCSADVLWMATKKNSAFMVKSKGCAKKKAHANGGLMLNKNSANLKSMHTFRNCGLSNASHIEIAATGAGDEMKIDITKGTGGEVHTYKGDFVNMAKHVAADIDGYRADLKGDALCKLAFVHKAIRMGKAKGKK